MPTDTLTAATITDDLIRALRDRVEVTEDVVRTCNTALRDTLSPAFGGLNVAARRACASLITEICQPVDGDDDYTRRLCNTVLALGDGYAIGPAAAFKALIARRAGLAVEQQVSGPNPSDPTRSDTSDSATTWGQGG